MNTPFRYVVLTVLLVMAFNGSRAEEYFLDKNSSSVRWHGKKVTGEHRGTILLKSGTVARDGERITGGFFEMDMNSIVNEDVKDAGMKSKLVDHLKSDDFFSVKEHPYSTLRLTKVNKLSGNEYEFAGDLTIKGITRQVTFRAGIISEGKTLTTKGKMVINRALYNIRYGSGTFFSNLGDRMIYDDFTLDFTVVTRLP